MRRRSAPGGNGHTLSRAAELSRFPSPDTSPDRRRCRLTGDPGARAARRACPSDARRTPSGPRRRARHPASRELSSANRLRAGIEAQAGDGRPPEPRRVPSGSRIRGKSLTHPDRSSTPVCSCLTASAMGCELVSSSSRLPAARMRARKSRAPGSQATCERTSRCNAPMSMPSVAATSIRCNTSRACRCAPRNGARSRHRRRACPARAQPRSAAAPDRARCGCHRPGRAACRRGRGTRVSMAGQSGRRMRGR